MVIYDQKQLRGPWGGEFLTALTSSFLKTSSTHICRCSKSGGKKVTVILWDSERKNKGGWRVIEKAAFSVKSTFGTDEPVDSLNVYQSLSREKATCARPTTSRRDILMSRGG